MVDARRRLRILTLLESIVADVRFAVRLLRKNAVVTAAAVLSLSLAIGACVGSFSLIDALILRPLPVSDPQRLVYLTVASPDDASESAIFNYPLFVRMRDAIRGRLQLVAISFQSRRDAIFEDAGGQAEKVYAQWISGDALPMLGVRPALGRLLLPSDDVKPGQRSRYQPRLLDPAVRTGPVRPRTMGDHQGKAASDRRRDGTAIHRCRAGNHDRSLGARDDVGRRSHRAARLELAQDLGARPAGREPGRGSRDPSDSLGPAAPPVSGKWRCASPSVPRADG